MLVPVVCAAIVAMELAQGQLAHSLVSRPERMFGASDSRWFAVLVVAGGVLLGLQLALVGGVLLRAERRRVARVALAVAAFAAAAGYGVTLFAPDPHLYEVSQARGLAALVLLICTPAALVLVGAGVGGRGRAFAWLSALLTLPAPGITLGDKQVVSRALLRCGAPVCHCDARRTCQLPSVTMTSRVPSA